MGAIVKLKRIRRAPDKTTLSRLQARVVAKLQAGMTLTETAFALNINYQNARTAANRAMRKTKSKSMRAMLVSLFPSEADNYETELTLP